MCRDLSVLAICAAALASCGGPSSSDTSGQAGAGGAAGRAAAGSGGSAAGTGGLGAAGTGGGGNGIGGNGTGGTGTGGGATAGNAAGGRGGSAVGGSAGTGGAAGSTGGSSGVGGGGGSAAGGSSGGGGSMGGRAGAGGSGATGGRAGSSGGTGGPAGAAGSMSGDGGVKDGMAGANGDGGAYQPCPADGTACKILPLGDSITYGVNDEGNGGYRGPLFAAAVAAGKKITFTGSLSNGPTTVSGQTFPQKNEGHSGWGISEVTPYSGGNAGIATVIPSPAFSSGSGGTPNIILLHIGTNDQGSYSAAQMTSDLKGLLDKIITNAPDALLVVAQIIPLGYGTNDVIKAYNQAIPGAVQERAAAGKHIVLVDMYTGFTPSTMLGSDNIHPNTTGYKFMADHWYAAVGSLLH